jgi:protein tyrosine phosphatase (PTP) superfamily phosphohydrolase (DUF442 family)
MKPLRIVLRSRSASWPAVAVALAIACSVAPFACHQGRLASPPVGLAASRVTDEWVAAVREQARHGYWIAIRGTHPGDQLVAVATASELTHVVVYDADREEVIEAVGHGVGRIPLRELLAQARRVQIIRPPDWTDAAGRQAVERASLREGLGYDFLGTVGLPQAGRYYCTELALEAWCGRERQWAEGVLHPEQMQTLGEVVFDSGLRDDDALVEIDDALRSRFACVREDATGFAYAAEVAPGIWRGSQPDAEGIAWLQAQGIATVVNLRHYHGTSESRMVDAAGLRYERLALESTDAPTPEQVEQFLALVTDPAAHPIYIHCRHGVDRTGAMLAVYRMEVEGWSNSDALAEMEWFGAHGLLHDLRRFVAAYAPSGRYRAHAPGETHGETHVAEPGAAQETP